MLTPDLAYLIYVLLFPFAILGTLLHLTCFAPFFSLSPRLFSIFLSGYARKSIFRLARARNTRCKVVSFKSNSENVK